MKMNMINIFILIMKIKSTYCDKRDEEIYESESDEEDYKNFFSHKINDDTDEDNDNDNDNDNDDNDDNRNDNNDDNDTDDE